MTQHRRVCMAVALALQSPLAAWAQCAMCRASLLNSENGLDLIAALRQGVLLLLAAPLTICAIVLLSLRRAKAEARKKSPPEGFVGIAADEASP